MKIARPHFVRSTSALSKLLQKQLSGRRFVLLTDENVGEVCMPQLGDFLAECPPLDVIEVEAGELCKSHEVAIQLWTHLIELEISKSDVLVCLGGGSVTDLGGFVAATFKRGIPVIFIPTTLLAMTDAAIGGKNGIDLTDVKNAIGTISQPEAVLVYPGFCDTLSYRQWLSGFAEIVKHGVIAGGALWNELRTISVGSRAIPVSVLKRSVMVKHAIVREDPLEKERRMELNFGHTVGHAIESVYMQKGNPIEHGYAVAMGMIIEVRLAVNEGFLSPNDAKEIIDLIRVWFENSTPTFPQFDEIRPFLAQDKKIKLKNIVLFLPSSLGVMQKVQFSGSEEIEVSYSQAFML
jgi:3-dehydroquinate synthase